MNIAMQSEKAASRLRLRHDLVFAQVPGGALVRHSDGGFVLRGQTTYRWLASLAPFLDGSRTAEELVAGLDESRSQMVDSLLAVLRDHDAVSLIDGDPVDPTGPLAPFRAQIAYIDHYANDGLERFRRFRAAHVTVEGDPEVSDVVRRGLQRNGLLRTADADETPAAGAAALRIVIDTTGDASAIARATREPGSAVYPVTRIGDQVILGPITRPGSAINWAAAMARLTDNDETPGSLQMWRAISDPAHRVSVASLSRVQLGILGTTVAYDAFRYLTAAPPAEADDAIVIVDLTTGDTSREAVLPDPRSSGIRPPDAAEVRSWPTAMDSVDNDVDSDRLQRYLRLVGEKVGVVTGFTDELVDQSPIKIARAVHRRSGTSTTVLGFSLDNLGDARRRAMEAAALLHVSNVGPREPQESSAFRRILATELEIATGLGPVEADDMPLVPGITLGGERVLVPQAAVWSRHAVNSRGAFERTTAGEGAGATLAEAVAAGLLSAAAFRALSSLVREGDVHDIPADGLNAQNAYLLDAARLKGLDPVLVELPHTAVGTVLLARDLRSGEHTLGSGWDVDQAAQDALLRLLGRVLVAPTGAEPDRMLIPDLDVSTLALRTVSEPFTGSTEASLDTVVVDTTTADIRATGALHTVRVLLPADS